jgi:hypothetical protein
MNVWRVAGATNCAPSEIKIEIDSTANWKFLKKDAGAME